MKHTLILLTLALATSFTTFADKPNNMKEYELRFTGAPIQQVMEMYREVSGKDVTIDLGVFATVTYRSQKLLSASELLEVIETELKKSGVKLVELDKNTIRVRQDETARKAALDTNRKIRRYTPVVTRRKHTKQIKSGPSRPKTYTGAELREHLKAYNLEVIRKGLPELPVPLTKEQDKNLIEDGGLPPQK